MLPGVSALTGENLNREGFNPLVTFYVMIHSQHDIRAPRRALLARASICAHKHDAPPEVGITRHSHTDTTSAKSRTTARFVHGSAEGGVQLRQLPAAVRKRHTRKSHRAVQERLPRNGDTAWAACLSHSAGRTSARRRCPPTPDPRSTRSRKGRRPRPQSHLHRHRCDRVDRSAHSTARSDVRRRARACAGSRAPSRAALERAPTTDPREEICR